MCTGGALLSWLWLRREGGGRLRDVPYGVFSVRLLLCFWNDERRRLTGVGRQPVSLAPRPAACGPARPSAQGRAEVCVSSVRLPALGPRGQRRESPAGGRWERGGREGRASRRAAAAWGSALHLHTDDAPACGVLGCSAHNMPGTGLGHCNSTQGARALLYVTVLAPAVTPLGKDLGGGLCLQL